MAYMRGPGNNPEAALRFGVKLAAFKDGLRVGGVLEDRFDLHSAIGQKATLAHPPDKRYAADGALSLVDGRRGSARHTDGRWLGFQRPDLEAVIEFDTPRAATTVSASFLESPRSWIFLPAEVEFFASADGVRYERLGRVVYPEPVEGKGRGVVTAEVKVKPGPPARFLKVMARNAGVCPRWHSAAGQPAWLFVDEIVVR
jgi:hexosaminidase